MRTPASLLLLAAIDGFPLFVHGPEMPHRRLITEGLFEALLAANDLELRLAATEEDALLLYRAGTPPRPALVLAQARRMFEAFHAWIANFRRTQPCGCLACRRAPGLNLRIIAHAGPLALASGPGPDGDATGLLHQLLTNSVCAHEYVLLTDALLAAERAAAGSWAGASRGAICYDALGEIGYVSVSLRDPSDFASPGPIPKSSTPFLNPDWAHALPGLPGRLALN